MISRRSKNKACHCEEGALPDEAIPLECWDCFAVKDAARNDGILIVFDRLLESRHFKFVMLVI